MDLRLITLFFLYGSGNHRDLLSSPPPRSSDLIPRSPPHPMRHRPPPEHPPPDPSHSKASNQNGSGGDRKSTRLNSSHQIISYAVFCLKKKNTTRQSAHRSDYNPLLPHSITYNF